MRKLAHAARILGRGDLTTRLHMGRNDEFGEVADAFDEMAERIAHLLQAQQGLIANVSHELRTPLARIRVALDLGSEGDARLAHQMLQGIDTDLAELECLMGDVFQMAKLDLDQGRVGGGLPLSNKVQVSLGAVIEESVARFEIKYGSRKLMAARSKSKANPARELRCAFGW